MSALNLKKKTEITSFPLAVGKNNEIDLLSLVELLWQVKKRIIATAFACACAGLLISFLLPPKWTSEAVITPAEPVQWQTLNRTLSALRVLDLDISVSRDEVFNLFIKKFNSASLLEGWLRSSDYVMERLKGGTLNEAELHQAIVALSAKMKAVDSNAGKKNETTLYSSWTLSFSAPDKEEAQAVLAGYIQFISAQVEKETLENIRHALEIKTHTATEKLAMERVKYKNQLAADIRRLNYSLDIASAAGIQKPVYSNGQAVKDDPDFSIALGADGIRRKLEIEQSVTDVAEIHAGLRNQQYLVERLREMSIDNVTFAPFKYQKHPSLPVKKEGPRRALIIMLAAVLGGVASCGVELLRHAMLSRRLEATMPLEERLI
ncbi:LPS O-antigen length regulator Wzz(fepE) [Intestinirhabdus alba]|jgi:LPS O-antigen subunit length determinant protein (WzzB/FepE family)|uniref:LPS O-antigen length regulator n=1 Tax=Intestinirhabdus alba TaxID=2899544 RepID=A0A6L6IG03_9ENTR|nr:LPS O-antigen length regulator Wzz(fepE) [Intestinirhabdus alba]MTH44844.1 LPS O-antigen length regulator [Intestinirhabdus alba]